MNKEREHAWKRLGESMGIIAKSGGDGEKSGRRKNEEREIAAVEATEKEGETLKSAS
jgi:hypothetical protein